MLRSFSNFRTTLSVKDLTTFHPCYSRYYVQPQWIFDCVNAQMLLPPEDYFIGAVLPPHLSPFVEEGEEDYVPPEKQVLLRRQTGDDSGMYSYTHGHGFFFSYVKINNGRSFWYVKLMS